MIRASVLATVLAALAFAGACASTALREPPGDLEVLVYQTEGAFMCGRCDSLKFSLASDGRLWVERGHWAGRNVWRREREFLQVPTERAAHVWMLLEPYRPATDAPDHSDACEERIPDQGGVHLSWRVGATGKSIRYSGCDSAESEELRQRLNAVLGMLGLKGGPFA